MATFTQRITELIGSEYTTIASNSQTDLINSAINEVADTLPIDLLLKYVHYKTDITSAGLDNPEEKKILLVTREVANSGTEVRECNPIPFKDFLKAQDSTSLYFATAESPVYTYDITTATDPKIKIAPVPDVNQIGTVWHFNYHTADPSSLSNIPGLPDACLQAVILKSCINILQTYISDQVQDEEDVEIQNMLNNQLISLQNLYTQEIARFVEQDSIPRGE